MRWIKEKLGLCPVFKDSASVYENGYDISNKTARTKLGTCFHEFHERSKAVFEMHKFMVVYGSSSQERVGDSLQLYFLLSELS